MGSLNQRSMLRWISCIAAQKMMPDGTSQSRRSENTSLVRKRDPRIPRRRSTSALIRLRIRRMRSVRTRMALVTNRTESTTELVMYDQENVVAWRISTYPATNERTRTVTLSSRIRSTRSRDRRGAAPPSGSIDTAGLLRRQIDTRPTGVLMPRDQVEAPHQSQLAAGAQVEGPIVGLRLGDPGDGDCRDGGEKGAHLLLVRGHPLFRQLAVDPPGEGVLSRERVPLNAALHEPLGDLVVGEPGAAPGQDEPVTKCRLDPGLDLVQGLRRQPVGEPGTGDILVPLESDRQVDDGGGPREDVVPRGDAGESRRESERRRGLELSQSRLRGDERL